MPVVFTMGPSDTATREDLVRVAAERTGQPESAVRTDVETRIDHALEEGTLCEENGVLSTRDRITNWMLEIHAAEAEESEGE